MSVTRREAVANFLKLSTHGDLAKLYTPAQEVQVNVAQDGGERVEGTYRRGVVRRVQPKW